MLLLIFASLVIFAAIMYNSIEGIIVGCLSSCTLRGYTPTYNALERLNTGSSVPFSLRMSVRGRKGLLMSEERQITEFVGRFSTVSAGGSEMAANPSKAVKREGFSPRVAQVVTRLVPHLSLDQSLDEIFKPGLQYW
jgi:hypothetical protein